MNAERITVRAMLSMRQPKPGILEIPNCTM